MGTFKKIFLSSLIVGCAAMIYAASSDFSDYFTIKGIGTLTNTAIAWIDTTRDFILYDGDIVLGGKGSTASTTAGEYPGVKIQIKNCGATAWVQGTLVTVNDTAVGCGQTSPATNVLTDWLGISEGAVAVGAVGYITSNGYALALTTGAVNRGDVLVSSASTAGYLGSMVAPTTGSDVAVALASGTAAGGLTLVKVR